MTACGSANNANRSTSPENESNGGVTVEDSIHPDPLEVLFLLIYSLLMMAVVGLSFFPFSFFSFSVDVS